MGKKAQAAENIKVLVRCRPLSEKEKHNGHKSCIEADMTTSTVTVKQNNGPPNRFTFDAVITNTFTQKDIFTQYIQPLVDCELEGVTPRCVAHLFNSIKEMKSSEPNKVFTVSVTFVELYNGKVRDLLAKQQVTLDVRETKDHTFFVQGANIIPVKHPEDVFRLMEQGTERRRVASTELNADSSRSHSIFTLSLDCTESSEDNVITVTRLPSKLNLVDLAGSERQGKTGATGETLTEGCNINLSLSALGTVIDTIVKGAGHVPFRSSQLTMLLKDSLGGNSKTVMFANINPSDHNTSETISTLRFADRAKQIKNKPVVNLDPKDQMITELTAMVQEMKEKLHKYETGGIKSLEKEVEELRDRESELRVSLDNAIQGRQADSVDFENAKAKFAADTQTFNARLIEQEDQIAKLKNDLQIAETRVADGATQANEILQICTTYLRPKEPFRDADDLQHFLHELTSEGGMLSASSRSKADAEVNQLKSKIQALEAENQTVKKEMKSKVKEMKERREEDKKSIHNAETKIKKLQAELKSVKEKAATDARIAAEAIAAAPAQAAAAAQAQAQAQAVSSGEAGGEGSEKSPRSQKGATASSQPPPPLAVQSAPPVSPEDLKVVTEAIASFENKNIVNSAEFKKADACMEDLQRAHREVQNGVGHELSSLKKHLGTRKTGEGDQAAVIQELQDLVHQSDQTIASLMTEVATSHQLLANMRSVMKKTGMVPLSVVKGDSKSAEESIDALTAVEEQANSAQAQMLEKITENLNRATTQRNRLLSAICDGEGSADIKKELKSLMDENQRLQQQKLDDLKEVNGKMSHSFAAVTQQQLSNPFSPAAHAAPAATISEASIPTSTTKDASDSKAAENSARLAELEVKAAKYRADLETTKKQLHDMRAEVETLKAELAEEHAARESQEAFKEKLYEELQNQREEISESERRNAELQTRLSDITREYEQKLAVQQHKESEVKDLEVRLQKRSEQLNQLRKLLETQKTLIVRSNEKIDYYQQKLKEAEQVTESTKAHFERLLTEKDESVQRIINQRMAEYSEACKEETNHKQVEIKKYKKKIKKLQEAKAVLEEEYDKKVVECEEFRNILNEQKVQHLKEKRLWKEDEEKVEVIEQQDNIKVSLEKAKEERKRRANMFDMGEVENAKNTASRATLRSRGSDASDGSF
eukprot:gene11085-7713_t